MSISKSVLFEPKVIPAGLLGTAFLAAIGATGISDEDALTADVDRTLADGSRESRTDLPVEALDSIVDLREKGLSVRVAVGTVGTTWHYLAVYGGRAPSANIHVDTPTAGVGQAMIAAFMTAATLEPYVAPLPATPAEPRAPAPDPAAETPPRQHPDLTPQRLRAFVSYRFSQPDNETTAGLVQRFLELQQVDVLTGRSYEPRPLHEKVSDRLRGVDFLVLLIGQDGESPWTRDEIATARATGVPVIPIVSEGSSFEPGLFGDLEYITIMVGHVGDAFLPLMEAITYIRRRSR